MVRLEVGFMFQIFAIRDKNRRYLKTPCGDWTYKFEYALIWTDENEIRSFIAEHERECGDIKVVVFNVQEVTSLEVR